MTFVKPPRPRLRVFLFGAVATAALGACPGPQNPDGVANSSPSTSATAKGPPEAPPPGRLPEDVAPKAYELALRIDPSQPRFRGEAKITITTRTPKRTLWLHGVDLAISHAELADAGGATHPIEVSAIPERGLLRLALNAELPAGRYVVDLAYDAPFAEGLTGIYRVKSGGADHAFSQFEPIDARRAFPCFDDPSIKATFDVSLTIPPKLSAISNGPAVSETPAAEGWKTVRFKRTPKLPAYLVAFAVGDFDIVQAPDIPPSSFRKAPIPLRGVAVRGKGPQLALALRETAIIVQDLEAYFGIAYPFDKLDILAVPDFGAGAMENAGAITFRESFLLVDPAAESEDQKRSVLGTISHELAHQWFGNLVTMAWWDDLWLNEAFAEWMGVRVVERRYPAFRAELGLVDWAQGAMETDSLASARHIRQPVVDESTIEDGFDDLTYSKGAALIRMFEAFAGEKPFQDGIRRYLAAHAFGAATTEQFLRDVFGDDTRAPAAFTQLLSRPGVPRVTLTATCDKGLAKSVSVEASRYLPLGSKAEGALAWHLPVCIPGAQGNKTCAIVDTEPGKPAAFPLPANQPCPAFTFPSPGATSYARYTPSAEQVKALFDGPFAKLEIAERLAAVDAVRASFRAGAIDAGAVFDALPKIAADPERMVAFGPTDLIAFSARLVAPADRPAFSKMVAKLYLPVLERTGWDPKAGEDPETGLVRADALDALTRLAKHAPTRDKVLARAKKALGLAPKSTFDIRSLPTDLQSMYLRVAVEDGGKEVFDAIAAHLHDSKDAWERRALISALASSRDADLSSRARALLLSGELATSETFGFLAALFTVDELRDANWKWLVAHLDDLIPKLPGGAGGRMPGLAEGFCDGSREAELRKTFAPYLEKLGAARALDNSIERLAICQAISDRQRASVAAALAKR
ncbi:MAG: M1 family metallopeptidase [Polyangiaceae bacterium]